MRSWLQLRPLVGAGCLHRLELPPPHNRHRLDALYERETVSVQYWIVCVTPLPVRPRRGDAGKSAATGAYLHNTVGVGVGIKQIAAAVLAG